MNNEEIRRIAYKLYWKEDIDLSSYDERDKQAILEDLSIITKIEDDANNTVDEWLLNGTPDWRFNFGI